VLKQTKSQQDELPSYHQHLTGVYTVQFLLIMSSSNHPQMHRTQLIMVHLKIRPDRKPKFAKITEIRGMIQKFAAVRKFMKVAIAMKNLQP